MEWDVGQVCSKLSVSCCPVLAEYQFQENIKPFQGNLDICTPEHVKAHCFWSWFWISLQKDCNSRRINGIWHKIFPSHLWGLLLRTMEAADRRKAQDTHLNVCQVQVTNPSITKDEMMAGMAAGMGANLPIFTEPRAGLNSWAATKRSWKWNLRPRSKGAAAWQVQLSTRELPMRKAGNYK